MVIEKLCDMRGPPKSLLTKSEPKGKRKSARAKKQVGLLKSGNRL
jgi:hypothetical protein